MTRIKIDEQGKIVIPEATILRQCINYLITKGYEPGVDFGRVNTSGTYDPKIKCYRRNPWLLKGMPDILGFRKTGMKILDGSTSTITDELQMFAIECKSSTGKLSPKQAKWRDKFILTGGLYILARDVDDVIRAGL